VTVVPAIVIVIVEVERIAELGYSVVVIVVAKVDTPVPLPVNLVV